MAIPAVYPQAAGVKATADDYKKSCADVIFKSLDSKKNEINTSDPALKEWLMTYGPVKVVHDAVVTGQAAEKANRLGDAFTAYDSVATSDSPSPETKVARDSARRIADKANAILAGVDRSLAAKDAASAARALIDMQSRYAGSDFGVKAAEKLKSISSEPAVVKMYAQMKLDADADALEAQALAFERSQDFLRAMTTYDAYLTKYPTSHRAAAVKARLAALHADKSIQAKQADTDCKSWLSLADNFIRSGLPDKARPQLQKIIDAYGDTTWAEQARARLKQLDSM